MIVKLTEEELRRMLSRAPQHGNLDDDLVAFAHVVQDEIARREGIMRRREGCAHMKGHQFLIHGGGVVGGEINGGGNGETVVKWDGYGECTNCDATLGITYRENV